MRKSSLLERSEVINEFFSGGFALIKDHSVKDNFQRNWHGISTVSNLSYTETISFSFKDSEDVSHFSQ